MATWPSRLRRPSCGRCSQLWPGRCRRLAQATLSGRTSGEKPVNERGEPGRPPTLKEMLMSAGPSPDSGGAEKKPAPRKALVVDDSPLDRLLASSLIQNLGNWTVLTAG